MKIVIIQGHPDNSQRHFGHALAEAYAEGARASGHEVSVIDVAALDFPVLRSTEDWKNSEPVDDIADSQKQIHEATHIAIFYPLWLGTLPALLKAFFEQVFRPGYAMEMDADLDQWTRLLRGKSARIVVTMRIPAAAYRLIYQSHSLKSLERNILKFVGIKPIRETLIGRAESPGRNRDRDLKKMRRLGAGGR